MTRHFSVTWDYRCPYARIAHDHLVTALRAGPDWEVRFLPFSLGQIHRGEGQTDVWDDPESDSGMLALQTGVAVRDLVPGRFLDVHQTLFDLRHVHAGDLRDRSVIAKALAEQGIDAEAVLAEVDGGRPLATIKAEHEAFVTTHRVWGVPTFIVGERAVFVRLLHPADGDATFATSTIERVLDQVDWPILNEFKHTSIPR